MLSQAACSGPTPSLCSFGIRDIGTSSAPFKAHEFSAVCVWCSQLQGPESGKRRSETNEELFSNNNAILLSQDVISQTCALPPTLPGLGGERWVAAMRDRKATAPRRGTCQQGMFNQKNRKSQAALRPGWDKPCIQRWRKTWRQNLHPFLWEYTLPVTCHWIVLEGGHKNRTSF